MSDQSPGRPTRAVLAAWSIALALLIASCGSTTTDAEAPAADGTDDESALELAEPTGGLPDIVADTASGATIDFNQLNGNDLLLWFWAPW